MLYEFPFLENADLTEESPSLWYPVGRVLNFADTEDVKSDMKSELAKLPDHYRENANRLIGRLNGRIHTMTIGNHSEERSQGYDKVLQIFVRTNSASQPLEYSDCLLSTRTWSVIENVHTFCFIQS